jgi:hypothetical protein
MINGISGSTGSFSQMQGMQQRKGMGERFRQLDADKNGGLDQTELQTMTDKISEMTGQKLNVEEITKTYDANNEGLLGQGEMQSMMMELRGSAGSSQGGKGSMQSMLSSYQADPEKDSFSALMDMFGEQEDKEDDYSPVNIQA